MLGAFYVIHCVWAAAEAYSAPSIVLTSQSHDGLHVFDDFRESYAWLSHNTDVDDKVASWWDYGYQTTAMANRTVIVDNNTWNNTHIATVGTAMSSPEKAAWEIFNSLDVKYVLVVFGGVIGYPSDDINKFLWMVRIGGGEFPHIKEADYLRDGQYRIDSEATPTMLNCLMYKLCYYRFVETDGKGYDRVRRTEIGKKYFKLTHFEELTINRTSSLDKKRTLTFTILGLGLVGPALHFWYLYLSKVVTASGLSGAVLRLLLDQFVFAPIFVGVFLSAVVTLEGKPSHVIPKLKQEWTGAVVANWQLWIPFQFLNFRFVPQNFQVLASNVVALAWNVILSFKAHKEVVAK
ncbi:hypothetical protein F2Q70_00007651 [Brassica cretica]|uniref:dolichyl-diphosphooligosaccharide--protein glycotransferase n=1 Tax=Brassica cretica TaxID=69181 RepID=A0A8S9LYY4_BRACR|nr:hypothetical protein F2Q70_00007651 [Brassica cretica]